MLDKATEKLQLSAENRRLKEELREHTSFANIVARSDKMRQLFHLIKSVAPTDAMVSSTAPRISRNSRAWASIATAAS